MLFPFVDSFRQPVEVYSVNARSMWSAPH